jgi:hypothetical protein
VPGLTEPGTCLILIKYLIISRWQVRRASLAFANNGTDIRTPRSLTTTEFQQLQNDLDIPLTIFMTYSPHTSPKFESKPLISNNSSASLRLANTTLYQSVLEHVRALEKCIQQVILLTGQLIEKQATVDVGSLELKQLCREDSYDEQQVTNVKRNKTLTRGPSFYAVPQFEAIPMIRNPYKFFSCFNHSEEDNEPLPSLRNAVDLMLTALIQFLHANNRFICSEFVVNQ